jgi:ComF family protein
MQLRALVSLVAPPLCVGCGAAAGRVEPLCEDCRNALQYEGFGRNMLGVPVWSAFRYDGGARALVKSLKFRGTAGVAATMGAQIAATVPAGLIDGFTLVPVPLHKSRLRKRGFNQAALLAHEVGLRRGCQVADCLERVGRRTTQVGRSRLERLDEIDASVRVREGSEIPTHVVLVDDVATTGATLSACARALYDAGTELLGAFTYARTWGR